MGAQKRALLNIGDFELEGERRFRVYADPEWMVAEDRVTVSRVHPDPLHGKDLVTASGLDSADPKFRFPECWSESDRARAQSAIVRAWCDDWRAAAFDADLRCHVLPVYIGARRLRLLRPPWQVAVTVEVLHDDDRKTWAGTFYRFDRGLDHRECWPLLRISHACRDWLGRDEGDPTGVAARRRLREAAWLLWVGPLRARAHLRGSNSSD